MAMLGTSSLPPGVTGASGLNMNEGQVDFLRRLRAAVPASIPLYVTSATRTAREQASAMKTKRDLGDNLRKLYGPKADAVLAAPNTVDAMTAAIEGMLRKGIYMSKHMRGDAVDLRSRNWSSEQRKQVEDAVRSIGGRPLYETTPPHLHVDVKTSAVTRVAEAAVDTGVEAAKTTVAVARSGAATLRRNWLVTAGVFTLVALVGGYFLFRKPRRVPTLPAPPKANSRRRSRRRRR